jgi:hypothetical protein
VPLQGPAKARREGQLLQIGEARRQLGRSEPGGSGGDGPIGADGHRRRGEQVGDVARHPRRGRTEPGVVHVDEPGLVGRVDQEVGRNKRTVSHPGGVHRGEAPPRRHDGLVDAGCPDGIERSPVDEALSDQHPPPADALHGDDVRRAHAGATRPEPDERFVLDGLAQRPDGLLVADGAEPDPLPCAQE